MLHNEARKLLIKAWNKTHNAKEIAECFSVNTSTVYRLEKECGKPALWKPEPPNVAVNQSWVRMTSKHRPANPTATGYYNSWNHGKLQLHVSDETVRKAILKLGYVYKRNLCMRQNRSVPDVKEKRKSWREHLSENDANHLVFLDESGVNTDMTRHYARSKRMNVL